jgi:hypothetical protein
MKAILLNDWFAPEFSVRIQAAPRCGARHQKARIAPLFSLKHAPPGRQGEASEARRIKRFGQRRAA